MVAQFGDAYRSYLARTGMFFPRALEQAVARLPLPQSRRLRGAAGFVLVVILAVGGAFALRAYTVAHLPLWASGRVVALTILPGDGIMLEHRMRDVLELPAVELRLAQHPGPLLVYLVPKNYVMQGMITDWIFHPFRHLQGGHMMMHHDLGDGSAPNAAATATLRRLIFLSVDTNGGRSAPADVFAIDAERTPLFFADVDIHNLVLQDIKELSPGTGWGRVPTPMF
jgi:hypothetical protein